MNSEDSSDLKNLEQELIEGMTPRNANKKVNIDMAFEKVRDMTVKDKIEQNDNFLNDNEESQENQEDADNFKFPGTFGKKEPEKKSRLNRPSRFKPLRLEMISPIGISSAGSYLDRESDNGSKNGSKNGKNKKKPLKRKLTKTEISSPIKISDKRKKAKRLTWKQVQNALALDDSLSPRKDVEEDTKLKLINEAKIKDSMDEIKEERLVKAKMSKDEDEIIGDVVSPTLPKLSSPSKSPEPLMRNIMGRLNDSVNPNNMSRRSIMKIRKAGTLNQKPRSEEEVRKRLLNLQLMDENSHDQEDSNANSVQVSKKNQRHIDQKKIDKIMKLGPMGMDLEELRDGISRKYDEMISQLKNKLDRLKIHFSDILDSIKNDFSIQMMNEKNLNLENIKKLESILHSTQFESNNEEPEIGFVSDQQITLLALRDFFNFVKEFKEESYSLIISQLKDINLAKMKKELDLFANQNLNSLYETPKSFPTQLYRFFYDNQEIYEEDENQVFGSALGIQSSFPEEVNFKNTLSKIEPNLENFKNRTPLVKILSEKYIAIAGRNDFKIFEFGWNKIKPKVSGFTKAIKSRFFKKKEEKPKDQEEKLEFDSRLVYSSLEEQIRIETERYLEKRKKEIEKEKPAYHYLGFENNSLKPEELNMIKEQIRPGFHCISHLKVDKKGKQFLLFGGNHNRVFKYQINCSKGTDIEGAEYKGEINFKKMNPDLPRQKINGIYQYKKTTNVVCIMSYGYVAIVDIDLNGNKDKLQRITRIHRGNISSATFGNDFEYFVTCSGSFSRNHDNSIVVSRCSLAQDLFLKKVHSISNAHGKYKGVMDVKSTNNVSDDILISTGNDDDSRILIHDMSTRTVIKEIHRDNYGFYYSNIIVFDKDDDSEDEISLLGIQNDINGKGEGGFMPKKEESEPSEEDKLWKTEGVVIIVAGITQMSLFVYDHVEKIVVIEEDLEIHGDIGSYLGVMDMVKDTSGDQERYYLFTGTTEGDVCVFELGFKISYYEKVLEFGNLLPLNQPVDIGDI